ncbi:hypothetical protein O181_008213 [Austropuccinia psidii MF-1]|uniref:Fatty acid hydroxylase domain-containing protein n=1 Tax=Austropuccinia psidii MF-1 TaxID=1389203 RepID=A0A9Q3BNN9_9BASI|nr:hypothetical protein [Austropuccinia psidii MF-1]
MFNEWVHSHSNHSDPLLLSVYPKSVNFPLYHYHRQSIVPGISDPILSIIVPVATYWIVSLLFTLIDYLEWPSIEKFRIHDSAEVTRRNRISPQQVIKAVIIQQVIQTLLGLFYLEPDPINVLQRDYLTEMRVTARLVLRLAKIVLPPKHAIWIVNHYGQQITQWMYWWGIPIIQFFWASFVLDTWQYFWHRAFHQNHFLYKHIHSVHHRLYCPYSFGALYNHPLEGFVLDSLGAVVAHWASAMSIRQACALFGITTAKTVDDHCGLALPWDPLQHLFGNNAAYHDIHHQQIGLKKNFSQPYFIHWDMVMGTRMTYSMRS